MRRALSVILGGLALLAAGGCATTASVPDQPHPAELAQVPFQHRGDQLDSSLARLDKQLADMRSLPETPDPTLREIRALDLVGWQLHQQQWLLQREHFRFALGQLREAKAHPENKAALLEQWVTHEKDYEKALDDFRQQRHELEQKRHQIEAQLVERYLR
jgi:primosomal protein N''